MKRSKRGLSKKGLTGLKRVRNSMGLLVWSFRGQEYGTLREVVTANYLYLLRLQLEKENKENQVVETAVEPAQIKKECGYEL